MKFLIGSSYFDKGKGGSAFRRKFSYLWSMNTAEAEADRVVIICEADSERPLTGFDEQIVSLSGDLGHCHDLISGKKNNAYSGWSASMMALAMLAYTYESDFIYKEEDCLAFGDWVDQMYLDLGDADLVFGRQHRSPPWMPCSQSLFLVRHKAIPNFVNLYLQAGRENDVNNLGEHKFIKIKQSMACRELSFGCDRERPIPMDDPIFYAQQISESELNAIITRELL